MIRETVTTGRRDASRLLRASMICWNSPVVRLGVVVAFCFDVCFVIYHIRVDYSVGYRN